MNRTQRDVCPSKRDDGVAMAMHDRPDIFSGGKNSAVNEAFVVGPPAGRIERRPIKRELHNVLQFYTFRGTRPRHEETIRAISG